MYKKALFTGVGFYMFYFFWGCSLSITKLQAPQDLIVPPESETETSFTLLWNASSDFKKGLLYEVRCNGKSVGLTDKTFYTVSGLSPGTGYSFSVKVKDDIGKLSSNEIEISHKTKKQGKIFNILEYGANGNGLVKNTEAIQMAINACTPGGTVYIPAGIFLSGALFMKSDMTLYIDKGGVLKGSTDPDDYRPFILNRYSGWEMETYASLINAGILNHCDGYNITNLSIRGEGIIFGGGAELGNAMQETEGYYSRGRLICLMNCKNVNIQGLSIENSPSWTIHYIYSKNVTLHALTIISRGIRNGDGIDPDSSEDSYIFNCKITTSDDCIAIKSRKNPEGNKIGKPTKNVFVAHCLFNGHGMSIGTEMSGGVSNVTVRDCKIMKEDLNGLQIKVPRERGGYVRDIRVENCTMSQIKIITKTSYNVGYEAAPDIPFIEDLEFVNLDISNSIPGKPAIIINGFEKDIENIANILFKNILVSDNALISLNNCSGISFEDINSVGEGKPVYKLKNTKKIEYGSN